MQKVLIVASCGPELAQRTPAPFLFAQHAAALGHQVSICFVLQAPLLLKADLVDTIRAKEGGRTMREWIDGVAAVVEAWMPSGFWNGRPPPILTTESCAAPSKR